MSNFWRTFGFTAVSAIETILDREQFTLEELLDEEEIIQETKTQNKKLLDYLIKPEPLEKLLEYLTKEPEEDAETKRKFKYPYVACEILCSEVMTICDAIYQNEAYLDAIYSFLDKDLPSNSLLASYTSRVAGVLLQRKVSETIAYLKKKGNIIDQFIKHLNNSAVMDLLLKIISCEETQEGQNSQILQWLCVQNLIPALVEKFDPSNDADVHENAAQALVDIIAVSNNVDQSLTTPSPLIAQLESKEIVEKLFSHILSGKSISSLQHGLTVIIELLKKNTNPQPRSQQDSIELPVLFTVILENINHLTTILTENKPENTIFSTVGEIIPFGIHRLKIVEFLLALIKTNHAKVDEELIAHGVLSKCLDVFFTYKWNNFLHAIIEQIIFSVIDGENEELTFSLFSQTKLADRIIEAWKENEDEIAKPKGMRRGYMGHLMNIIGYIVTQLNNPLTKHALEENEAWKEFIEGPYEQAREVEKVQLGGPRPFNFGEPQDDDDDDERGNSELVNVFTQYLVQQGYTSDFVEEFNNDDDDEGELNFANNQQFDGTFSTNDKQYMDFDEEEEDSDSDEDDSDDDEYYSDEDENGQPRQPQGEIPSPGTAEAEAPESKPEEEEEEATPQAAEETPAAEST